MNTTVGQVLAARFPTLKITEDIHSDTKYWVNVYLNNCSLVIENIGERGFGISVVADGDLDFGGHDEIVKDFNNAIQAVTTRITDLTTT